MVLTTPWNFFVRRLQGVSNAYISRLTIVSREAKKKQRPLSEFVRSREHQKETRGCPSIEAVEVWRQITS